MKKRWKKTWVGKDGRTYHNKVYVKGPKVIFGTMVETEIKKIANHMTCGESELTFPRREQWKSRKKDVNGYTISEGYFRNGIMSFFVFCENKTKSGLKTDKNELSLGFALRSELLKKYFESEKDSTDPKRPSINPVRAFLKIVAELTEKKCGFIRHNRELFKQNAKWNIDSNEEWEELCEEVHDFTMKLLVDCPKGKLRSGERKLIQLKRGTDEFRFSEPLESQILKYAEFMTAAPYDFNQRRKNRWIKRELDRFKGTTLGEYHFRKGIWRFFQFCGTKYSPREITMKVFINQNLLIDYAKNCQSADSGILAGEARRFFKLVAELVEPAYGYLRQNQKIIDPKMRLGEKKWVTLCNEIHSLTREISATLPKKSTKKRQNVA